MEFKLKKVKLNIRSGDLYYQDELGREVCQWEETEFDIEIDSEGKVIGFEKILENGLFTMEGLDDLPLPKVKKRNEKKEYHSKQTFGEGEKVEHPKFRQGIVVKCFGTINSDEKVTVQFEENNAKTLLVSKSNLKVVK